MSTVPFSRSSVSDLSHCASSRAHARKLSLRLKCCVPRVTAAFCMLLHSRLPVSLRSLHPRRPPVPTRPRAADSSVPSPLSSRGSTARLSRLVAVDLASREPFRENGVAASPRRVRVLRVVKCCCCSSSASPVFAAAPHCDPSQRPARSAALRVPDGQRRCGGCPDSLM
jgi:hypothetical protein